MRTLIATLALLLALPGAARAQTLWAVGDGAVQGPEDEAVADRIQAEGPFDRLLYLGDVYEHGTAQEFATNYETSYGRFKAVTSPTPGNHEWANRATGYDAYWGSGVRQPDGGHWYSFDLGGWHIVSLSTMEDTATGSPQHAWLEADLARYPGSCTIAFSHHPRYSAGPQWNDGSLQPLYNALAGRSVALLSGHAHNYQRHVPWRGITQFVVGTGGRIPFGNVDQFDPRIAASNDASTGALRLRLGVGVAQFEFVPPGGGALDAGALECVTHVPAPARHTVSRPRNRARYPRLRTLSGRVTNARRLRLRLVRRVTRRRCEAFDGRELERASCRTRLSFPIVGRDRWKWKAPRSLPRGGYRLEVLARSVDDRLYKKTVRFSVGGTRPAR